MAGEITTTNPMNQPDAFGNYYQPGLAQLQSPYQQQHLYHNSYNRKTRRAKKKPSKFSKRTGAAADLLSEKSSSNEEEEFYLYDDTERRIENIQNNKAIFR